MRRVLLGSVAIVAVCGIAPLAARLHRHAPSYSTSEVESAMFASMGDPRHPHPYWPIAVSCVHLTAGDEFFCAMTYRGVATGQLDVFPFGVTCDEHQCIARAQEYPRG